MLLIRSSSCVPTDCRQVFGFNLVHLRKGVLGLRKKATTPHARFVTSAPMIFLGVAFVLATMIWPALAETSSVTGSTVAPTTSLVGQPGQDGPTVSTSTTTTTTTLPPSTSSTTTTLATVDEAVKTETKRLRSDIYQLKDDLKKIAIKYDMAQGELEKIALEQEENEKKLERAEAELAVTQAVLNKRLEAMYLYGRVEFLEVLFKSRSFFDFLSRLVFFKSISEQDGELVASVEKLKHEAEERQVWLEEQMVSQSTTLVNLEGYQVELENKLGLAREVLVQLAIPTLNVAPGEFVFPVAAPYTYTDSWGAPRMTGTPYEHRHQGSDIFALRGTPLVAVADGTISKLGTGILGGISVWLTIEDGSYYYYGHLEAYAPGIYEGKEVAAGEILGYVGNTGNARGTPPHLHFEVHPQGGEAINPYFILVAADKF